MSTLLRNARLDGAIVDVLVRDGRITRIGALPAEGAREVDLDGRWLLPGMWDNHVHFTQYAMVRQRLDLAGAESAAQAAALVAEAVAAGVSAGPLIGY